MRRAARGLESVAPVFRVDLAQARTLLERIAPRVRCEPLDARLDIPAHRRIEARPGFELDVGESLERIERAARGDEPLVVTVAVREIVPDVTTDMLADVDVTHVLSAYETDFRGHAGARAINIARAARFLDGTMIAGGKPFSFNRIVGPRTAARGFVEAPVIVADEMEKGLGGGVCQVATTLHAAAVFGGLDVLERRSHSRPSSYAPIGLDATVVEDKVDLRLKNPYGETLMIHAFLPNRTQLRIELLGRAPPGKVEHFANVRERHPFCRRVAVKTELASDAFDVHQKGRPGLDVVSVVRTTLADGTRESRSYRSKYWPVPEVVWVGPGFDLAKLPALPDGAVSDADADDCAPPPQSP
jgi:vancomycin resistance protein YoaR